MKVKSAAPATTSHISVDSVSSGMSDEVDEEEEQDEDFDENTELEQRKRKKRKRKSSNITELPKGDKQAN
jgi:hypothetical protein